MPQPNAEIRGNSAAANRATQAKQDQENRVGQLIMTVDPYSKRKPEYYIGVFNVSKTTFKIPRSWVPGGLVTLEGRDEGQLYGKPFIIPDVKNIMKPPVGNDEITVIPTKGEFLAQDICNCNDPQGSWETYRPLSAASGLNVGNNYYDRGIVWCRLATPESEPDPKAIDFAIMRLETYYNGLINEANTYYSSGPKEQIMICAPHHEAAQYFIDAGNDLDLPWHKQLTGNLRGRLKKAQAAALEAVEGKKVR
jgi:hypothetical protein